MIRRFGYARILLRSEVRLLYSVPLVPPVRKFGHFMDKIRTSEALKVPSIPTSLIDGYHVMLLIHFLSCFCPRPPPRPTCRQVRSMGAFSRARNPLSLSFHVFPDGWTSPLDGLVLFGVGTPCSRAPPASFHAGRPPSRTWTPLCPNTRNVHQQRGALKAWAVL